MDNVKVLLLSASQWDFIDDKTNEQRKGTTVFLIHLTDGSKENVIGIKPTKYTLDYDEFDMFKGNTLPAYAMGQFKFDFSNGKIKPYDFTSIKALEVGVVDGKSRV